MRSGKNALETIAAVKAKITSLQASLPKGVEIVPTAFSVSPPTGAVMLEFKAEKGKQSLSQKWWQGVVQDAGYRYEVIRSVEDFQRVVASVE